MSTKDARKNQNAQFGKQQDILPLPHISAKTLFEDKQEAEKWYTLLYQRRMAITNLIDIRQLPCMRKTAKRMPKNLSSFHHALTESTDISLRNLINLDRYMM